MQSFLGQGIRKDPDDKRDYLFTSFVPANGKKIASIDIPKYVDYRDEMTPVKFQGNLGSCVAFSVAAIKEWADQKEHNREVIAGKEYKREEEHYNYSEQWVYWNCKKIDPWPNEEGTNFRSAMKVLNKIGVPPEDAWPYKDTAIDIGQPEKWSHLIARWGKIGSYWRINGLQQVKEALTNGPLLIGIHCFEEMFGNLVNGVIPYPKNPNESYGGHAIAVVSFDDDKGLLGFKNSWSVFWGDRGYGYLPYEYIDDFMIDAWVMEDMSVQIGDLEGSSEILEKG